MTNNIKTEIIYYGLPTDFEFEFNLCGSCQMRLLTNTANDTVSLLKALQTSIKRSRAIIIIGNLKGENGIISLVSKSIGYTCDKIDDTVYNVKSPEEIIVIKNSVPLITDDGEFGGCIIESGPQSMIFLSEDRKIRKEIMSGLVHGYIKDLSEYPIQVAEKTDTAPVIQSQDDTDETVLPQEQITEQTEDILEVTEVTPEEELIEETLKQESEEDPYDIDNILTENTPENFEYEINNIVYEDEDYDNPPTKPVSHGKALDITSLILSIVLLLALSFVVYAYIYLPLNNGISIEENFKNIFSFLLN